MKKSKAQLWIESHQGKHFCECGCGGVIVIKIHHHTRGIPRCLDGHYSRISNGMSGMTGSKNPNFNGGRYTDAAGYICILIPMQERTSRIKYMHEHRYLMQKKLGRRLTRDEVVHHLNGIKTDNRLENLEIKTNSEHTMDHARNGDVGFGYQKKKGVKGWWKKKTLTT